MSFYAIDSYDRRNDHSWYKIDHTLRSNTRILS